jgi:hypothetical protein
MYLVPLPVGSALVEQLKGMGKLDKEDVEQDARAPEGKLALAQIYVTLASVDPLVPKDEGFGAQLRTGLSVSVRGLLISASWLLAAVVFLLPWALLVWLLVWLVRRSRSNGVTPAPAVGEGRS